MASKASIINAKYAQTWLVLVLKGLANVHPVDSVFQTFSNFLLIIIHDQITNNSFWPQNWGRVKNLVLTVVAQKAHTTVERNWRKFQRKMGRLGVIQLNCNDRWESWVEYWRICNGFPALWLAAFSVAWYIHICIYTHYWPSAWSKWLDWLL